ncbi:MAG: glycosyltransferase family 2 protein [Clostridia bacterium]
MDCENKIELSIIIPHFNSPIMLDKLLQTIPVIEKIQIIVVDDRSTESIDEYNKLKFKYAHVLFLSNKRENKGAGAARNTGLEYAKGKWLLFADSDDYFLPYFYDTVKEYFNSDLDIVYFTPTSIEIDTGNLSNRHQDYEKLVTNYILNSSENNELNLRYKFFVPWSKLIRKSIVVENNITFSETLVSNDVIFSIKSANKANKIIATDKIIYCVTRGIGTLTTTVNAKKLETRVKVDIEKYKYLKENSLRKDFKKLELGGLGYAVVGLKQGLGLKFFLKICFCYIRNGVPLIAFQALNPKKLIKKVKRYFKSNSTNDRYIKK